MNDDLSARFPEQIAVVGEAFNIAVRWREETKGPETVVVESESKAADEAGSLLGGVGRRFGDYELLEEIARGGMGVVVKARQVSLNRTVAVKLIGSGALASPQEVERFRREAEAAARLDHPGIVPVYEVGAQSGQHFFSMGYVEGESLAARLRNSPLSSQKAAEILVKAAQAIDYAHKQGVIHRDLKPGNILLDSADQPRVTDFGLAKQVDGAKDLTATGQMLGTPSYMPPEQAAGRIDEVGPLSDVYSLGATLYAALTGRPPFRASSPVETSRQVIEQEPVAPRALNPAIDRDLETITLKCLSKEPSRRYATAAELADDLSRYLAGEPIHARPVGLIERTWRWSRRHPAAATAALAVLVGLVSVSVLSVALAMTNARLESSIQEAETARDEARAVLGFFQEKVLSAGRPEDQDGGLGFNTTILTAINAAEPHVAEAFTAQPLVEANIRGTLGTTYNYLGDAESAIRQHQRARELFESNLGLEHTDTLASMNNLALAYKNAGKLDQALPLYEQSLHLIKAQLGKEHPRTLTSMDNLAGAYFAAGKLKQALPLYQQALDLKKSVLGPEHASTLLSMNNLARAHRFAGKLDRALPLHEQALELMKAGLGLKHPYTLRAMNDLAVVYRSARKLDKALPLHEQTVKLMKAHLGPQHPATLTSMNEWAVAYRSSGKLDLAIPLFEETLQSRTARLGPEHPHTLKSMGNLAVVYHDAGKLDLALPMHEQSRELLEKKLGPEHPDTLAAMNNLADAYRGTGKLDLALPLYKKTQKLLRDTLGPEHPHTLASMGNLAVAYQAAGKLDQALPLYEKSLDLLRDKLGPKHPYTLATMGNLAEAYLSANQAEKALPLYDQFFVVRRSRATADDLRFASRLASVSRCFLEHRQYLAAEKYLRECLAIRQKKRSGHWLLFDTKSMLGAALAGQEKFAEAEPLLVEGYEGLKRREDIIPAKSKTRLGDAVQRIVELYHAWGKPEQAEKWSNKLPQAETAPVERHG